jgi:hypothetical protein
MNNQDRKQGAFGALGSGLARAFQWRLLVLWVIGLLVPTLVATLPVWQLLSDRLDYSVHVQEIATRFDLGWMFEVVAPFFQTSGAVLATTTLTSLALVLLRSPWLTGMVVASIRAGDTLRFGNLLQFGLREYGRMARMMLWSVLPLGVAFAIGGGMEAWASKQAETMILESGAINASRIAMVVLWVAFVLMHATVEAGRGVMAADPSRRSAVKAWWRGAVLLARRPVAVLVVYLGATIAGLGLALVFAFARTQVGAGTTGGLVLGVLLVQLIVMAMAWGRIARLYGLSMLARDAQQRDVVRQAARREAAQAQPAPAAVAAPMDEAVADTAAV